MDFNDCDVDGGGGGRGRGEFFKNRNILFC